MTRAETRGEVRAALLLAAATLLAYLPVLSAGFVWDDDDYVTANATLRSLSGLRRIWTEPGAVPQYYPLTFTSLWIDHHLWGLAPGGYHAVNVLLHATGAILLYAVLRRLRVPGALVGAALFALHPVHVESVAWVTERKNVLSGVCYLGALLVYLPRLSGAAPGRGRLVAALALFAAALLSKTVTCTWPIVVLLLAWWRWPGRLGAIARDMAPALALGAGAGALTIWMERVHVGAVGSDWELGLAGRLLVAGRVPWFYLTKLLLPIQLAFIYPRWTIDPAVAWQWAFPAATTAALALLVALRRRIGDWPLVAALVFLVTLAPAAGFVNVYPMRYSFVADHFQYLASIAPLAVLGAWLARRGAVPAVAVPMLLGVLAATRTTAFADAETLWRDTIAKVPHASMPRLNLGLLLQQQGRLDDAVDEYERALREHPDEPDLHDNLALALNALGRTDEALAHWRRGLALAPDRAGTRSNLANALAGAGALDDAIAEYDAALRLAPDHADVHGNLANVLAMQGRTEDAITHYRTAARLDPTFAAPRANLGRLLLALGRADEAEGELRAALALEPNAAGVLQDLGRVEAGRGRFDAALAYFERARRAAPGDAQVRHDLGGALAALGRRTEAVMELHEAARLAPDDVDIHNDLGVVFATGGDRAAAAAEFREALRLAPDDATARANLAALEAMP